jgi:FPC/CPF motif-containing protein YcgG
VSTPRGAPELGLGTNPLDLDLASTCDTYEHDVEAELIVDCGHDQQRLRTNPALKNYSRELSINLKSLAPTRLPYAQTHDYDFSNIAYSMSSDRAQDGLEESVESRSGQSLRQVRGYCYRIADGRLTTGATGEQANPLAALVHGQFRGALLSPAFPCLGGASAVRRGDYRFALYGELGSPGAAAACADDLRAFVAESPVSRNPVAVFVAAFDGELITSEAGFELALWRQLRAVHEHDPSSDSAPFGPSGEEDPGFYFADRDFFIVGLHPAASRWARRFAWPVLVFNALSHADALRAMGKTERMRERILARDHELQGTMNPSLDACQLAQFSGAPASTDWHCPVSFD